ncbi:MAG: hypothetical protein WAU88_07525, partial [Candidatus Zixiibacteriota bacterium]
RLSLLASIIVVPIIGGLAIGTICFLCIISHIDGFQELALKEIACAPALLAGLYLYWYWYLPLIVSVISVGALRKVSGLPAIPPRKRA